MSFRAIQVTRAAERGAANRVALVELDETELDASPGEVLVEVAYSSLNFKDALALTGRPGIVRRDELIAGIDLVGVVRDSHDAAWKPGDRVIVTGHGLGETHPGGLSQLARVPAAWLRRVPARLSLRQAAAIGTAGVTAALAVDRLVTSGCGPASEVIVTGATGGLGSLAVLLGRDAGWRITAVTGRAELAASLLALGASEVLARSELEVAGPALASARWHGGIDTVGGAVLARLLAGIRPGGTVAACGNAADSSMTVSVLPFILRGVTLAGINSVEPPSASRDAAWARLERDLDLRALDALTTETSLSEAIDTAAGFFSGRTRGRIVVDVAH